MRILSNLIKYLIIKGHSPPQSITKLYFENHTNCDYLEAHSVNPVHLNIGMATTISFVVKIVSLED